MCVIISEMDFTLFVDIIEKWRPQKIQLINLINCSSQKIMKLSLFNISLLLSSVNKSRPIITLTLPIRVMKPVSRNLSFVTSIVSINSHHQVNLCQLNLRQNISIPLFLLRVVISLDHALFLSYVIYYESMNYSLC